MPVNESKSFNQWMVDQGFNAIRHANCCRIAYEGGQQSMQAIIDDLIYKAKLRESDHQALLVKYQATKKCWEDMGKKCESLKAQLNNMEACYIEKKKQVEAVSQVHAELEALKAEDERNYIECCKSNS